LIIYCLTSLIRFYYEKLKMLLLLILSLVLSLILPLLLNMSTEIKENTCKCEHKCSCSCFGMPVNTHCIDCDYMLNATCLEQLADGNKWKCSCNGTEHTFVFYCRSPDKYWKIKQQCTIPYIFYKCNKCRRMTILEKDYCTIVTRKCKCDYSLAGNFCDTLNRLQQKKYISICPFVCIVAYKHIYPSEKLCSFYEFTYKNCVVDATPYQSWSLQKE
jgi:hypothetical protein